MGLIPEETIAQILDRSDIVELIASYVPLKKPDEILKGIVLFIMRRHHPLWLIRINKFFIVLGG